MVDKHFFDLLKEKAASLRPAEQHRDEDWAALGEQLNTALPIQPRERRRTIILPLLLLTALLSTNAVWWHSSQGEQFEKSRLEAQVKHLTSVLADVEVLPQVVPKVVVLKDTVWRTSYIKQAMDLPKKPIQSFTQTDLNASSFQPELPESSTLSASSVQKAIEQVAPFAKEIVLGAIPPERADSMITVTDLSNIKLPSLTLLKTPERPVFLPLKETAQSLATKKTTQPFGQNLLQTLRPKFFKAGASAGWLYANSAALMHEGGFNFNLQGQIGITRHWSVMAGLSMGRIHYKAHNPAGILGAPELPMLPSMDHHFAEMDVTGQKIRQFDFGLRYTFAQAGKPRPFLGLGWGRQTLLPFTVEYEIQHESSVTFEKGVFEVTERIQLRNMLELNTGIEIPFSPRLGFSLEGFYRRQGKKPSGISPDLMGIQAGLDWLF